MVCVCAEPEWIASSYGAGIQAWHEAWSREALRVLKPGAMLLAFGGTRTFHRLTCALEDAGFEIRDTLCWLYGSGFPKSLDISKAIDKAAGVEREVVGAKVYADGTKAHAERPGGHDGWHRPWMKDEAARGRVTGVTVPATDEARRWSGYGTSLKPAWEPCIVAMKPLDGTFAHNAQEWGVAGINVDGSRIPGAKGDGHWSGDDGSDATSRPGFDGGFTKGGSRSNAGRWPANVVLDPEGARQLDEQSGERKSGAGPANRNATLNGSGAWSGIRSASDAGTLYGDTGGASRFFFAAKVSTREREGSDHPTMKPIDLTRYLARLILPPQRETPRRLLVPFAGVGSEMIGAILAGWDGVVGIEKDEAYAAKARERIVGTAPLFAEAAK